MTFFPCSEQIYRANLIFPPFQNVGRFDFSKFIVFDMHLDIIYV